MKTNLKTICCKLIFISVLLASQLNAQTVQNYSLPSLLSENKLEITNGVRFIKSTDEGKDAITIDVLEQVAWLKGVNFSNGEIELDLKGKDALQNSFLGVAFHGLNDTTYDAIYFRPFNFQATDSVRHIHAVQYISRPDYPWERLRKEQNAKYEKAIIPAPDPNAWFHARIVVNNGRVKVYVNNASTPSLEVDKLNKQKNGKIGVWLNGNFASFANLKVTNY
jgi:hypothetical protein